MKSTIVVGPDKTTVTTGHMTTVFRDDTAADQVAMLQQEIQRLIGDVQTLTKSRDHYMQLAVEAEKTTS